MLKLLYQSLRAVSHPSLKNQLIRAIFEIKSVVINGEFPGIPSGKEYLDSTEFTIDYIVDSSIEKLYTFTVTDEVLDELRNIASWTRKHCLTGRFKSLEILETLS